MDPFLVTAAPFILALILEITSPLTTFFWKKRMESEAGDIGEPGDPERLMDVLNHAIDTVRIFTTSLLTVVSGFIALSPPVEFLVWIFILITVLLVLPFFWKHIPLYSKYTTKGYFGYTPASLFIIATNLVFIGAIWIPRRCS